VGTTFVVVLPEETQDAPTADVTASRLATVP